MNFYLHSKPIVTTSSSSIASNSVLLDINLSITRSNWLTISCWQDYLGFVSSLLGGSGCRKKVLPGSHSSQTLSGTPCGFGLFKSSTLPYRKPLWGEGPRGFSHIKKGFVSRFVLLLYYVCKYNRNFGVKFLYLVCSLNCLLQHTC